MSSLSGLHVLLDLDGTLTDPFVGITQCVQHALRTLGAHCPEAHALRFCIGPPLRQSFAQLLGAARVHDVERAMVLYRERFAAVGMFENTLYEGIPTALAELGAHGARLLVATSKPHVYAQRIVEHFGLAAFFDAVHGAELDGKRSEKHEVIGWLLECEGIDPRRCVMVGDRHLDIAGAAFHGIPAVGVSWGYGGRDELEAAGAAALCDAPAGIPAAIASIEARLPSR